MIKFDEYASQLTKEQWLKTYHLCTQIIEDFGNNKNDLTHKQFNIVFDLRTTIMMNGLVSLEQIATDDVKFLNGLYEAAEMLERTADKLKTL